MKNSMHLESLFVKNMPKIFENMPKIAVACSGGPDSICMLALALKWAKAHRATIYVLTCIHNLREGSYKEAELVKSFCEENNLFFKSFSWELPNTKKNIMHNARDFRYKAMLDFCSEKDILNLLVGHHKGDFLDNFFIKAIHGGNILGMSSQAVSYMKGCRIIRPLKDAVKSQCQEYLKNNNISYATDPTNLNTKFLRNRINISDDEAIRANSVIESTSTASDFIKKEFLELLSNAFSASDLGYITINRMVFESCHLYMKQLLLSHGILIATGAKTIARLSFINSIINGDNLFGASAIVKKTKDYILICKDYRLVKCEPIALEKEIIWDRRFKLKAQESLGLEVSRLKEEEFDKLFVEYKTQKEILMSLPAIRKKGDLIALPSIGYDVLQCNVECFYSPNIDSKLIHY